MPILTNISLVTYRITICLVALLIGGCAIPVSGLYSFENNAAKGAEIPQYGYVVVDRAGKISVYIEEKTATDRPCYVLARGSATNAMLQGQTLTADTSPTGDTVYLTHKGADAFGIYSQHDEEGRLRWFVQSGGSSVASVGNKSTVVFDNRSYSIGYPRPGSPTLNRFYGMICKDPEH